MVYHPVYVERTCPKCGHKWSEDLNKPVAINAVNTQAISTNQK